MTKKLSTRVFLLMFLVISSLVFLSYVFFAKDNSEALVYVDVAAKEGVEILASKKISREDFHALNEYQEFNLTFSSSSQGGVEFRVKCFRDRDVNLVIDDITLYDLRTGEEVFWESAADKPQKGPSWYVPEDQDALGNRVVQMDSQVNTESWLYGPYLCNDSRGESLANRELCVSFRLKIADVLLPIYVAELSVVVNGGEEAADCLADTLIDLSTVTDENAYNLFNLTFLVPSNVNQGVEFQVRNRNNGYCTLIVDDITVYKNNFEEIVYSECSASKLVSGEGWIQTTDVEASCPTVMFISSTQRNDQLLYGPQITKDANGHSMLGETYVASFRIRLIKT